MMDIESRKENISKSTLERMSRDIDKIRETYVGRVVGQFHQMGEDNKPADSAIVYADAVTEALIEKEYFLRCVQSDKAIDVSLRNMAGSINARTYPNAKEAVVMRKFYVEKVYGGDFARYHKDLDMAERPKDKEMPDTLSEELSDEDDLEME